MAEKYLQENRQNNVNIMHENNSNVNGVQMVQMFIKDSERGVSPKGFEDIADGSLFAEYHITNDEIWGAVKEGTYKGFSLEGYFDLEKVNDDNYIEQVVKDTKGKFNKQNSEKMSVKDKIAKFVEETNVKFGTMTTDKGILSWEGEEELKVGDKVYIVTNDEEGEVSTPAPDGEYIVDGTIYVVAEGEVKEIKDEEGGETEPVEEEPAAPETMAVEEDVAKLREDVDGLRKEVDELYKLVDKLLEINGISRDEADSEADSEDNMSKMRAEIEKMGKEIESIKAAPATEPAHEAFEKPAKTSGKETMAMKCAKAMRK